MKTTIPYKSTNHDSLAEILGDDSVLLNAMKAIKFYTDLADEKRDKAEDLEERGIRYRLRGEAATSAMCEISMLYGLEAAYRRIAQDFENWFKKQQKEIKGV